MEKKELEYPDAPSGYVTLYNYKEPFMKFDEGFGFQGVLLYDGESDKLQCHFCGEWFHELGHHLHREHAMRASEYKEAVGLNKTTALISETYRAKLIKAGLEKRIENFKKNKYSHSEETRQKISNSLKEKRRELQNIHGTCPEQLIDRLRKLYFDLGRTPRKKEIPFREALTLVYGSMETACRIADIPYRKEGQTIKSEESYELNKLRLIKYVRDFFDKNGRLPKRGDHFFTRHQYLFSKYSKKEIFREVGLMLNGRTKRVQFTRDELLDFIRRFKFMHGRLPSASDCRRNLLPGYSRYHYHFGSLKKACELI